MASSGEERPVVVDLRSAAESAGGEDAHATPLHEMESLCMRCGENVRPPVFCTSFLRLDCRDFRQQTD
jgi:zinc finger protein